MKKKYIKNILGLNNRTNREEEILEQHIKSDKLHRKDFIEFYRIYALIALLKSDRDRTEGKRKYKDFIKKRRNIKNIGIGRFIRYVAIWLVILVPSAFAVSYFYNFTKESSLEKNIIYVPAGQRARLTLSDGTVVWLNACSTFIFPSTFSEHKREVSVIGEAFFDVMKDKKRPFILSTQNIKLKVLGTKFNVHSYPESGYIRTDLLSGAVKIYEQGEESKGVIMKPNEQVIIEQGELTMNTIRNTDYFLWKEGIYSFDNENFIDIIKKLELYYDSKIIVKDSTRLNVKYTGKFRQRDGLEEILRVLQKVYPFKIQKDTTNNTFTLIR